MKIESYCLRSMPYAQCHVNIERTSLDGGVVDGSLSAITLVSYRTPIIRLTFDRYANVELEVLYRVDCSATTSRHVNRFTTEFLGKNWYHDLKKLYSDGIRTVNITHLLYYIADNEQWYENNGKKLDY